VLIPAHDEQRLIGSTLDAIVAADYPADLVRVHVVADNCTDGTAAIARAAGAQVHERHDTAHPGKGPALRWLLGRIAADEVDAYVFLDADTIIDAAFLHEAAKAMAAGASVVQGHYDVRDSTSSPVVAFRAAAFSARTFLRPLGRNAIGGSAGLYGNGMVFAADVIDATSWSDHLTEDIELHLRLLLESGTLVRFAPSARLEAEMPSTLEASRTQHERWEQGRVELARRYVPTLLRHAVAGGPARRVAYLDAALDQFVPPFSVVVAGAGSWFVVAAARLAADRQRRRSRSLDAVWATIVVLVQTGYVLQALRLVGAPRAVYRSLLGAPRMAAWKLGVWLRVLRPSRPTTWIRTTRDDRPAASTR